MQCYGTAVATPSTQAPASFGRSLTVIRKGQVTLRKELLAHLAVSSRANALVRRCSLVGD